MDDLSRRALTPAQFFQHDLPGGRMSDAHRATKLAYSTILRARDGGAVTVTTAQQLEQWSQTVSLARLRGVWIGAAVTLGLASDGKVTP